MRTEDVKHRIAEAVEAAKADGGWIRITFKSGDEDHLQSDVTCCDVVIGERAFTGRDEHGERVTFLYEHVESVDVGSTPE